MFDIFQLEFMQRAIIAGIILAPLLSILGAFVTLRKMSFFADGIAHALLLGVAIALVTGFAPFTGALILGIVLGGVTFFLERYTAIASDAIIGILFTTGLALGIIILSLQPGYQPDLMSFLFGNILSVTWANVGAIVGTSVGVFFLMLFFFKQMTLIAFSEELAWTSGIQTKYLDLLFYILLSVSIVLGVKLLGVILVSAFLITPAVTAKLITRSFYSYVFYSMVFALVAFGVGIVLSYEFNIPSGASVVVSSSILFVSVFIVKLALIKSNFRS